VANNWKLAGKQVNLCRPISKQLQYIDICSVHGLRAWCVGLCIILARHVMIGELGMGSIVKLTASVGRTDLSRDGTTDERSMEHDNKCTCDMVLKTPHGYILS